MDCSLLGAPRWLRGLIKPSPGRALASIDWAHQEYGIAAALSGDEAMIRACVSGDPYLAFGHIAGLITENSTAEHVGLARRRCKTCALAVLNGMGAESLGSRLDLSPGEASELLLRHKRAYPRFWDWSDGAEMVGLLRGELRSVFGWTLRFEGGANPRAIRNFPCQANGAEMLRWACSLAIERGVEVAAPAHDALLVEGPTDSIEDVVAEARDCMARASEAVLSGFRLATTARTLRWPDRFLEENAQPIWDRVVGRMKAVE
jgi:DNA polymerase I-like protein with 3'-5' exonuclease and polymerase domains